MLRLRATLLALVLAPSIALAAPSTVKTLPPAAEASLVAKQALDFFNAGNFAVAAELYRKASRIDPDTAEYLFGVGRSEQRAGRAKEALAAFEQVVARLQPGEVLHSKALREVEVLRREAAVGAATAATPTTVAVRESGESPSTVLPWTVAGVSVAAIAGGGVLMVLGKDASADANALPVRNQAEVDAYGKAFDRAERLWQGGLVATGVGVVGAGVATWLLLRTPARAALTVDPAGRVLLAVRF